MPAKEKAPTRAELEKVFGRPLTDTEYRAMLNIGPAPQVARAETPTAPAVPMQPQAVKQGTPVTAAYHANALGAVLPAQKTAQPVQPLFGLPPSTATDAQKQAAVGPFWYSDSAGGHAAGDVATAPEYVEMVKAQNATPVAPVATMEPNYQTALAPTEEAKFQAWVKANKVPFDPSSKADYDMRGYWKAQQSGDPKATQGKAPDGTMHFPDTWKTPYHKTVSNESIYAPPDAPHWDGNRLIDKNGNVIADESGGQPLASGATVVPAPMGAAMVSQAVKKEKK